MKIFIVLMKAAGYRQQATGRPFRLTPVAWRPAAVCWRPSPVACSRFL